MVPIVEASGSCEMHAAESKQNFDRANTAVFEGVNLHSPTSMHLLYSRVPIPPILKWSWRLN